MMILSLVVMTGLEKCCITSAYLQWLCHSGEQAMACGSLVLRLSYHFCFDCFIKHERHRDHFPLAALELVLSYLLASTTLGLCCYLWFSNTEASRLMKLHTHICHDSSCPLPWTVTDLDLLFTLSKQCLVCTFSSVS